MLEDELLLTVRLQHHGVLVKRADAARQLDSAEQVNGNAGSPEVAGEFKGDLVVEKLILHEKARVSGTFDARVLSVREGAQMNGAVNAGEARKGVSAALAKPVAPIPAPPKPTPGATTG